MRADLFEVLLDRAAHVETDLAERGYIYRTSVGYGMATHVDDHRHLISAMGAIIDTSARPFLTAGDPQVLPRAGLLLSYTFR